MESNIKSDSATVHQLISTIKVDHKKVDYLDIGSKIAELVIIGLGDRPLLPTDGSAHSSDDAD